MVINGNMGRKKKIFRKVYDLGDFSLEIDIYKKKVVFFHLNFGITRESNEPIKSETIQRQLKTLLNINFNNIKGRKIFDVNTGETLRGYNSYISMSGYVEIMDDYEEVIIGKCKKMIPNIKEFFEKTNFIITKRTAKKNGILEGNT